MTSLKIRGYCLFRVNIQSLNEAAYTERSCEREGPMPAGERISRISDRIRRGAPSVGVTVGAAVRLRVATGRAGQSRDSIGRRTR